MKTLRDELIITNPEAKDNELLGYFQVEMYGIAKYIKGNEVQAIFGSFRKTDNRTVLYSATVWAGKDGQPGHSYESEFEDDLIYLRSYKMRKSRKMQQLITKMAEARSLDLSQPETHFRVESNGFMDLIVENIGLNQVSVAHYYEQNGDLCQDPEVVFLVGCDDEWYAIEWTTPAIFLMGRVMGGYQRYVEIDAANGSWKRADLKGQRDLAIFANKWASNLKRQGFK